MLLLGSGLFGVGHFLENENIEKELQDNNPEIKSEAKVDFAVVIKVSGLTIICMTILGFVSMHPNKRHYR